MKVWSAVEVGEELPSLPRLEVGVSHCKSRRTRLLGYLRGFVADFVSHEVLLVVMSIFVDARKSRESVGNEVDFARAVADGEVELLQLEGPAGELSTKVWLAEEPDQSVMICEQKEMRTLDVGAKFSDAVDHGEGFQLVDRVLLLRGLQFL